MYIIFVSITRREYSRCVTLINYADFVCLISTERFSWLPLNHIWFAFAKNVGGGTFINLKLRKRNSENEIMVNCEPSNELNEIQKYHSW